ncbi:addiction module protein [Roseimicrobium gellanilyticum]|uniref:addiction module protein n=1 Tax=Roseimicrobium gellanilyticum TaxID=748857 RepID=UPI001473F383
MSATVDSVLQEALQLPEESRLELVEQLIICSSSYAAIEREQVTVAEARLEEMQSGKVKGIPLEQALREVREKTIRRRR